MTEAQKAQAAQPDDGNGAEDTRPEMPSRQVQVDERSWTIVDLPDGLSWSVYGTKDDTEGQGPRLAQVTISERGYFSTDREGTIRGPYPTLDEAVYPIGTDDRTLLDDPTDRAPVRPPVNPPQPRSERSRSRPSTIRVLSIGVLGVLTGLALRRVTSQRATATRVRPSSRRP